LPGVNTHNGIAINAADNAIVYDEIEDCEACKL
jgi:hypothetical protein